MANIARNMVFGPLKTYAGLPEELRPFADELMTRLDIAFTDLVNQLKAEPTLFNVDPTTDLETVEGSKPGDVAVYKDSDDEVRIQLFE